MRRYLPAARMSCVLIVGSAFGQGVISPSHPELLQSQIVSAYNSGPSSLVRPAGVYLIPQVSSGPHLDLENMTDFEIDAIGASLVFQDQTTSAIASPRTRSRPLARRWAVQRYGHSLTGRPLGPAPIRRARVGNRNHCTAALKCLTQRRSS
jgi:hypothetical protein